MSMFRPLLAEKVNLETLAYPTLASPKYDGYRCLINTVGEPVSRNMKPIPNAYVFGKLKELGLPNFDGELLTYTNGKVDEFSVVQSKLSSRQGMPEFRFMVFDIWSHKNLPFYRRNMTIYGWFNENPGKHKYMEHVVQKEIGGEAELLDYEAEQLKLGWEGVMVRSIDGFYKHGRSTTKEGILLKLKRFFDDEAVVIERHELMHNANEGVENALGYTERSSHKAGMQGMGVLGKLTVRWKDVEFDVGTGFNAQQREQYWNDDVIGKTLTFKYQSIGPNGKPRFPVFLGLRHDL